MEYRIRDMKYINGRYAVRHATYEVTHVPGCGTSMTRMEYLIFDGWHRMWRTEYRMKHVRHPIRPIARPARFMRPVATRVSRR